jgi:hypothetical protein
MRVEGVEILVLRSHHLEHLPEDRPPIDRVEAPRPDASGATGTGAATIAPR